MTKLRNRIVLILLALCLVVTAGLFVACGGDDNKKPSGSKSVTYTVTVKIDNEAVKGVKVTVKKGTVSFAPKTTGDDGKAEFSLAEDSGYTVELANLPDNYEVPAGELTFPDDRNLTVNLAEKFAYKVKLVNKDGTPFTMDGVTVGICTLSGTCLEGVELDANGVARIEAEKTDYHIQILGLPAGYAYECDSHGYSVHQTDAGTYIYEGKDSTYNSLSATVYEQEITIYQPNVLDFAKMTPLTDAQVAEYNDASRTITGAKAYKVQATVPAGETAYYTFNAEYSGKYTLYAVGFDQSLVGYKINPQFLLGENSAPNSGWDFRYNQGEGYFDATKGSQYYINVTAKDGQLDLEFIFTTPLASMETITGPDTVKAVINKEGANAVIKLAPTSGAAYKLTVQGDGAIARVSSAEAAESYEFEAADYKANADCTARLAENQNGSVGELYFAVSVKANSYPATVDVKVEKTATLTTTVENVQPTVTLAKFGEQTGKELVAFDLDGTASSNLEYNETDKCYHYGTVDGPLVVVILTKALPVGRFGIESPIIYLELGTNMNVSPYLFNVTPDNTSLTDGNAYKDYREMLRGFKDYKASGNSYTIPADITVQSYYAKYVNSDGAYPLTKDLEDYLKLMVQEDSVWFNLGDDVQGDDWLFACYYYDTYIEPDVIVGEYNHVAIKAIDGDEFLTEENGDLTGDEYALVINKRGTYAIKEYSRFTGSYEDCEKGTWTKSDAGVYTFTRTVEDGEDVVYNVTFNQEEGYVILMTAASKGWAFRNENSEVVDVIVGEYKFVRLTDADGIEREVGQSYRNMFTGEMVTVTEDDYKLTVNADGTFMVYELSDNNYVEVYNSTGEWKYKKGVYTFTVPDGDYDFDWNPIDLLFTVDYNIGTGELALAGSDTSEWEFKKDGEAFVGLYELVSFTEGDEEYEVGDTYGEGEEAVEITKDYYTLTVVGKTFEFCGAVDFNNHFEGTWTKTNGGKYTLVYTDYFGSAEAIARYNKVNNQVTLVFGDEYNGYTTYVFQKKASQTIDPIVGEYYATKMSSYGEETTVENGDFRSDEYKLVVKASGRFSVLQYDYPDYAGSYDDGYAGRWTKTEDGYAFTFLLDKWYYFEEVSCNATVSNDLTEISIVCENPELGWWFAKAEEEAGAADAIVGEYKFVMNVTGDGEVSKAGDSYVNRVTGETIKITADDYHLEVFKNGRYVITKLEDGEYAAELLGLWSKEGGKYIFRQPDGADLVTYGGLSYSVEFDKDIGRVALISENNGAWIFQTNGAGTVEAVDEDENGTCVITVDGDKYTVYTFGSPWASLTSENNDANLYMFNNGGIKFYYYSEASGNVLGAVAYSEGAESGPIPMDIVWKLDTVKTATASAAMEGEKYMITVTVTATDDSQTVYKFDMSDYL